MHIFSLNLYVIVLKENKHLLFSLLDFHLRSQVTRAVSSLDTSNPDVCFPVVLQQHDNEMDDGCSPQNAQSSKFAHWFVDNGMLVKFLYSNDSIYQWTVVYSLIS